MTRKLKMTILSRAKNVAAPLIFGVSFLAIWEGVVVGFYLKQYFWAAP